LSFSSSSSDSSLTNDDFILMKNLRRHESKRFHDLANIVDGRVFLVVKFHKIAKKEGGRQ